MQNHGDKILLGFLGFGLCVYLLSMGYGENSSADLGGDSSSIDPDTSIVPPLPDTIVVSQRYPDTSTVHPLPDIVQRNISLASYSLAAETATHWKLPRRLAEISGLAVTMDNRLLAHNDEKGVIYEVDYRNGSIVKAFQLADMAAPVADDFEGIATVDDQIYLVSSAGRLYECSAGADGESVLFNTYATGVGRECEIEGLAYDESQRALVLMCKGARRADLAGQLGIYHWSIDEKRLIKAAHIAIPVIEFSRHIGRKKFQPSGIERHPVSGNYFVVAARQGAIAEITPSGKVVAVKQFPAQWHRQAEGITFAANGALIVADEGAGGKARLTLYPLSGNRQ